MERQLTLGDLFKQLASIILIIVSVIAIVLGVRQTLQYSRDMRAKNVLMNSVKTYVEEELKYASDIRIAPTRPGEDYHTLRIKKGYLYKDNKRVLKKIMNHDNKLSITIMAFDLTHSRIDINYTLYFHNETYKERDTLKLLNLNVPHDYANKPTDRFVRLSLDDHERTLYYKE